MSKHTAEKCHEIVSRLPRPMIAIASLVAMSFAGLGCLVEQGEGSEQGEDIGAAEARAVSQNALTQNALTQNALTQNALTQNALTQNALTENALTQNGLMENPLTAEALGDPLTREFLKYVVSCALPVGNDVKVIVGGVVYTFPGGLGLAPSWGTPGGTCGSTCRAWVSACVLSRVNYLGQPVPISLRGDHPALASTLAEQLDYPNREATYWGDVFSSPQIRKGCLSPGETEIPRVCGPSISGCVIDVAGPCDDVCAGKLNDGSFVGCGGVDGADVTVFLH
jgi:hypothetical protein